MTDRVAAAFQLLSHALDAAQRGATELTDAELVGEVEALQRVINVASAAQAVRVAQFAAREEVRREDGSWVSVDRGLGHVSEFAGDAFGPALGMSPIAARDRAGKSAIWAARLPATLAAMGVGDLDPWRATVIAEELSCADRDLCAAVERAVFPAVLDETPGQLRRTVRRALAALDPQAVKRRAARALAERYVRVRPGQAPGVTEWLAVLPTETSALCWAAVNALAHQNQGGRPGTGDGSGAEGAGGAAIHNLDRARADALGDLILGNATVSTTAHLMVPVRPAEPSSGAGSHTAAAAPSDAAGDSAGGVPADVPVEVPVAVPDAVPVKLKSSWLGPCEVPGVGLIPAEVVAEICARFDTRIARVLLDPATGVTLESGARTYRPPARIQTFVRLRDGTCRFPGCARAARRCDTDHVVPWPNGHTTVTNLVSLCRHHHRLKHEAGWTLTMAPDGTCTWSSGHGQIYVTQPVDHLTQAVEPAQATTARDAATRSDAGAAPDSDLPPPGWSTSRAVLRGPRAQES